MRRRGLPGLEMMSEGCRHTCSWVVLRTKVGPTGPGPHYERPSPGAECRNASGARSFDFER
jgi:hypothetical protein